MLKQLLALTVTLLLSINANALLYEPVDEMQYFDTAVQSDPMFTLLKRSWYHMTDGYDTDTGEFDIGVQAAPVNCGDVWLIIGNIEYDGSKYGSVFRMEVIDNPLVVAYSPKTIACIEYYDALSLHEVGYRIESIRHKFMLDYLGKYMHDAEYFKYEVLR